MIANITNPKKFKSGGRLKKCATGGKLPRYSNGGYGAWGNTTNQVHVAQSLAAKAIKNNSEFDDPRNNSNKSSNWSKIATDIARIGTGAATTGNYGDALVDTGLSIATGIAGNALGPVGLIKYGADTLSDTLTAVSHNNSATGVNDFGAGAQGAKVGNTLQSFINLFNGKKKTVGDIVAGINLDPLTNAVNEAFNNHRANKEAKEEQAKLEEELRLSNYNNKLRMDRSLLTNTLGTGKNSYFMATGGTLTNASEAVKANKVNRLKYSIKPLYGSPFGNIVRMYGYGGSEDGMTVENSVPIDENAELVTSPNGSVQPNHGEPGGDQRVYNNGKAVAVTEPGEVIMTDSAGNKTVLSHRLGIAQEYQALESLINKKVRSSDLMVNNLTDRNNSKIKSLINRLPQKQERIKRELGIVDEPTMAANGIGLVPQRGVGKPEIDMLMADGGRLPRYANGSPRLGIDYEYNYKPGTNVNGSIPEYDFDYNVLYNSNTANVPDIKSRLDYNASVGVLPMVRLRNNQLSNENNIPTSVEEGYSSVNPNYIPNNIFTPQMAADAITGDEKVVNNKIVKSTTGNKGNRRLRNTNIDLNDILAYQAAYASAIAGKSAIDKMQRPVDLTKRTYTPADTTYDINPELANISDTTAMYLDKVNRESTSATGRLSAYRAMLNQSQGEVGKLRANQKQIERSLREANNKNIQDITDFNASVDAANKQQQIDFENQRLGAYTKNIGKLTDAAAWAVEREDMKKYQNQQLKLESLLAGDTHVDALTLKALNITPNSNLFDAEGVRKVANKFDNNDPDRAAWVAEYERRTGKKATFTKDGALI